MTVAHVPMYIHVYICIYTIKSILNLFVIEKYVDLCMNYTVRYFSESALLPMIPSSKLSAPRTCNPLPTKSTAHRISKGQSDWMNMSRVEIVWELIVISLAFY